MTLTHIVQFKFKPSVSEADIHDVCTRMLGLKDKCIHPTTQKTYIKSSSGGKDNSPEGLQNGFTHSFVVEFEDTQDRDYYVKDDEAHQAFVASLKDIIDGVQVLDYVAGVY